MSKGIMVSRQAGTAAAFAPLPGILAATGPELELTLFCYPQSRAVLARAGLSFEPIECFADAALEGLDNADFLLTGTSEHAEDDGAWWDWARRHGVPSVAFVDQWVNYTERFCPAPGAAPDFARVDRIAVIDAVARDPLVAAGCEPGKIMISGTPALDSLLMAPVDAGDVTRRALGCGTRTALLVYACETPLPADWPGRGLDYLTSRDAALALLVAALRARPRDLLLVIKPHPRQTVSGALAMGTAHCHRGLSIRIADGDRVGLVHGADILLGARSMLLYEATVLGKPVISIQPGRQTACDLTDRHDGIEVVTSGDGLAAALNDALGRVDGGNRAHEPAPRPRHGEHFARALKLVPPGRLKHSGRAA